MAKYNKNAAGLYETSMTISGKRVRFRGKTVAEVDRKIRERGEVEARGRPFSAVCDAWERDHAKEVRESTASIYAASTARAKAYFGARNVGDIKPIDVIRYVRGVEGKGFAKQTVSRDLTVVKQVFRHAVLCGDIDVSPAAEVSVSRGLPQTKRHALTEDQEQKVISCRKGKWWLMGLMLLYTGLRRGELLALTWQDIDRDAGVIHVTKKFNAAQHRVDQFLKSENGKRDVPLFGPLADAIPSMLHIGPIFTDEDGNLLDENKFTKVWKEYCSDAGLTTTDERGKMIPAVTPHCFRHSFSTICYEAGIDSRAAAAFLGDTEAITRNIYQELRDGKHATQAEKLDAYFRLRTDEAKTN